MARSKDGIRIKCEALYIENIEVTQKEVAELFKVTEKTIGEWVKKYDWEQKRLDFHASPTKIKQLLQKELLKIANGEKATLPADSISKLMATLDRLNKQADPIVVHSILKELDLFISQIDPAFASKCTTFHKQFLQFRISLEN